MIRYVICPDVTHFKINALILYLKKKKIILHISILYFSWDYLEMLIDRFTGPGGWGGKVFQWISDEIWGTLKTYL